MYLGRYPYAFKLRARLWIYGSIDVIGLFVDTSLQLGTGTGSKWHSSLAAGPRQDWSADLQAEKVHRARSQARGPIIIK